MAAYKRDKPSGPLGRALPTGKTVPISTFAALFSELISYHRARTASLAELESKLSDAGYGVGYRMFEMFSLRTGKRELDVISAMKLVSGPLWTQLFGRTADHLDVNKEAAVPEYRIWENLPATNSFISLPKEYSRFNPAAYIAGIVRGMLDGAGFSCHVETMSAKSDGSVDKTVYVIRFSEAVMAREGT